MNGEPTRAIVYARVSSEEQRENTSLDDQTNRCLAEAYRRGWTVVDQFREDFTGTVENRPLWQQVMSACRAGEVDAVIVLKWDRIARGAAVGLSIAGRLEDLGVSLVVLDADFDTSTHTGKMLRHVMLGLAEFDRDQLVERMARGQHAMAARGLWPSGGASPFGYRATGGRTNTLVVHEPEAQVLHDAAAWIVAEGLTTGQVCARLNAAGRRTRMDRLWTHQNLRRQLTQRTLVGEVIWGNTEKTHRSYVPSGKYGPPVTLNFPPILSEEDYQALHDALQVRATGKRAAGADYMLSGYLLSPCGDRYGGVRRADRNLRQYVCRRRRWTATGERRCADPRLDADCIEARVWEPVAALLGDPQRILALTQDYLALRGPELVVEADEVAAVEANVTRLQRALTSILVDLGRRGWGPDEIEPAANQIRQELQEARQRLSEIEQWRAGSREESRRVRDVWALAEEARQRLPLLSPGEKAQILRLLSVRATVLDGSTRPSVRVEGRLCHENLLSPAGDTSFAGTPPAVPRRR